MRRRLIPISYVERSAPRDHEDGREPTAEMREPEQRAARPVPPLVEYEDCERCGDAHSVGEVCATRLWDEAMDQAARLLGELRQRGAVVSLNGDRINVRGVRVEPEMVEALKSVKDALVTLLQAKVQQ